MALKPVMGGPIVNGFDKLMLVSVSSRKSSSNSAQEESSEAIMTGRALGCLHRLLYFPQISEDDYNEFRIACEQGTRFALRKPIVESSLLELLTLRYSASKMSYGECKVQTQTLCPDGKYRYEEIPLDGQRILGNGFPVYEYEAPISPHFQKIVGEYLGNQKGCDTTLTYSLICVDPEIQI